MFEFADPPAADDDTAECDVISVYRHLEALDTDECAGDDEDTKPFVVVLGDGVSMIDHRALDAELDEREWQRYFQAYASDDDEPDALADACERRERLAARLWRRLKGLVFWLEGRGN